MRAANAEQAVLVLEVAAGDDATLRQQRSKRYKSWAARGVAAYNISLIGGVADTLQTDWNPYHAQRRL